MNIQYTNMLKKLYIENQFSKVIYEVDMLLKKFTNNEFLYNIKGLSLSRLNQYEEALSTYKQALKIKPDYVEVYNNIGNLLKTLGNINEAMSAYQLAIKLKPDYVEVYNSIGILFKDIGKIKEASSSYDIAIQINSTYPITYYNKANLLSSTGSIREAQELYHKAIELNPNYKDAYTNLGNLLTSIGKFEEAIIAYREVLRIDPNFAISYNHISELKTFTKDDLDIVNMEKVLSKSNNISDQMQLSFALSKAYDDIDMKEKSFSYLKEGNNLRKKMTNYNINDEISEFTIIKKLFNKNINFTTPNRYQKKPIFILGMPRSGTTLIEQIISSHSSVYGAGELEKMGQIVKSYLIEEQLTLSEDITNEISSSYMAYINTLKFKEPIFTDKMPHNFKYIGFILSAFPNAKIINLNRDPMAICWSMYKKLFPSISLSYSSSFEDLNIFYKQYLEIMNFYRKAFPNKIYDLNYEKLTENQEEEIKKLLEYCELEFEENCLTFYDSKRTVKTASNQQVRKKIYTGSSKAWEKYKKELEPLEKLLNS